MYEELSDHDKDATRQVLAAAIAAAGPKGNNDAAWKAKVNEAIPHVVSMLNPGSRQFRIARQVMDAVVFTATYRGYTLEESSKRCVVTLETRPSKRYPDGLEPIRTHRTDTTQGKSMRHRLDDLEDGDHLLVWKAMESNDGGDEKYRVLAHFEKLPHRGDHQTQPAAEHVPEQPAEAPAYTDEIDSERIVGWRHATLERLTEAQMHRLHKALAKQGLDFYGVSEIEWVDVVRPLIREIIS
jgi:hypothetical protein